MEIRKAIVDARRNGNLEEISRLEKMLKFALEMEKRDSGYNEVPSEKWLDRTKEGSEIVVIHFRGKGYIGQFMDNENRIWSATWDSEGVCENYPGDYFDLILRD